jgi:DNA repair exonuclease SbcCD ATPase subunit
MTKEKLLENKNNLERQIQKDIDKMDALREKIEEMQENLDEKVEKKSKIEWELATKYKI